MNKIFSLIGFAAVAFTLSACAGNAPAPSTDVAVEQTPSAKTDSLSQDPQADSAIFVSTTLDSYRLNTPSTKFSEGDSKPAAPTPSEAQAPSGTASKAPIDPYTAFPALAEAVFAYADSLYKQGYADSATMYLKRFRIIKPLWGAWEMRTDSMLNKFGMERAEKAKKFEPLVLEIQNMNRAQAAYSMVASTADSLIALEPGDSLTNWATAQKQVAYKNTLAKAQKERDAIRAKAFEKAEFKAAEEDAVQLQLRYRDFEADLGLQKLIDEIRDLAKESNDEAAAYWKSHDPDEALARADTLITEKRFDTARDLLNKLKSSPKRGAAVQMLKVLGDAFCNEQRKTASVLFKKSRSKKDPEQSTNYLLKAIDALDRCLANYPDFEQKEKVLENKAFLESELKK